MIILISTRNIRNNKCDMMTINNYNISWKTKVIMKGLGKAWVVCLYGVVGQL